MLNPANIPKELKHFHQWTLSKDKIPVKLGKNGKLYRSNVVKNPALCLKFENALARYEKLREAGVEVDLAFVLTKKDPFVAIDFDKVGKNDPRRTWIMENCSKYWTETSRSGKGFHIFVRGYREKAFKPKNGLIEIYSHGRAMVITGNLVKGSQPKIVDGSYVLEELTHKFSDEHYPEKVPKEKQPTKREKLEEVKDQQLVQLELLLDEALKDSAKFSLPETIPIGARDNTLYAYAWSLRAKGYDREEIYELLLYANEYHCEEPLEEGEEYLSDMADRVMAAYEAKKDPENLLSRYVLIPTERKYFDLKSMTLCSASGVDAAHKHTNPGGKKGPPLATEVIDSSPNKKVAHGVGWHPTASQFFQHKHMTLVNTYTPPELEPVPGDVSLWLDLMSHIYGGYRDLVVDHMAFTVQNPEKKIKWQVIVIGKPRTGKTLSTLPLKMIFQDACGVVAPTDVEAGWGNIYSRKKALIFEELYMPGDRKFFNQFKIKLANDDVEFLNIKGQGQVIQQNLYSVYAFTNEEEAIHFKEDEEKALIIRGPDEKLPSEFYDEYCRSFEFENMANKVYHYLMTRDVSDFPYGHLPVKTDEYYALAKRSRPDFVKVILEMVQEGELPDIMRPLDLLKVVRQHVNHRVSMHGLHKGLLDAGCIRIPEDGRLMKGNLKIAVYALANFDKYKGMDATQLKKELDKIADSSDFDI